MHIGKWRDISYRKRIENGTFKIEVISSESMYEGNERG